MTRRGDEESAIFQVVEAIFVAVLVASALIFFALVQKPTPSPTSPGIDLARVAGDAIAILQGDDPGGSGDELQDGVAGVRRAADGSAAETTAEDLLRGNVTATLPDGLRFLLRSTGDGATHCVYGPSATDYACNAAAAPEPRNAQGSITYVLDGTALVLVELVVWNAF